jgi:hypothetical protein
MQMIWRMTMIGLLLSACAAQAKPRGISVSTTLINYKTGAQVSVEGGRTDRGSRLHFGATLVDSSNLNGGGTLDGVGPDPGLPEWVELTWREDPRPSLSYKEWFAIDEAERQARVDAFRALPLKSARVAVRNVVPPSVIEELEQSPMDPATPLLRLKRLRLYFIWTRDGVKLRWKAYEGCCTVVREGGDTVR